MKQLPYQSCLNDDSSLFLISLSPNAMAQSVSPLFRICEIMHSSLGPEPCYSGAGYRCFSQSLQINAGIVSLVGNIPLLLPSEFFPILYLPEIHQFQHKEQTYNNL